MAFQPQPAPAVEPLLAGVRIGVARDAAFSFIYPANLALLRQLGAELHFFSPLQDRTLPAVDSLYLPGGYPELHLPALAANTGLMNQLRRHVEAGKPVLAECGGMLWLAETLAPLEGDPVPLCGLLPARARMQKRFAALGLQRVELPEGTLRGHTFHHSSLETELLPIARGQCPNGARRRSRCTASAD